MGTLILKVRETVNNKPNIVRLQAGMKYFLFDPVSRQLSFRMTTKGGRSISLQRRIDTNGNPKGAHSVALRWKEDKGASLFIDGQFMKDGIE